MYVRNVSRDDAEQENGQEAGGRISAKMNIV